MVQLCGHSFLEALRDEMLQPFRFIMNFIPWVSKALYRTKSGGIKIASRQSRRTAPLGSDALPFHLK
jgi:hypothetical protein